MTDRARARNTDPATSHQAAASVDDLRTSQWYVLEYVKRNGPLTDEELVGGYTSTSFGAMCMQSPSGIRTRRKELVEKNLVHDTGERARLASGRKAIVWGYGPDPARETPATQTEPLALFP